MLVRWQSGQRQSAGSSIFFADRNTAVRGAEVPILPLNFPLKKSRIGTAGTWEFYNEYFNLGFSIMLVKKVVMPELYLIMVVKPSEAMIEIPNIQFLADKQYSICEKNITINQAVFPPHKVD